MAEPAFKSVLCGIDGSSFSVEAARQAVILASPGGKVELVRVCEDETPLEHTFLEEAFREARDLDVSAKRRLITASDAANVLLEECAHHDLAAVGSKGTSPSGSLFGATVSALVHRAHVPVLVARRPPTGISFPGSILLASDGSTSSERAATVARRIGSAHQADITVARVDCVTPQPGRGRLHQAVGMIEPTDGGTALIEASGDPDEEIAELAGRLGASLVVIGSRGLEGVDAIRSVSERVVREALCSVLVVRPPA
jgi:nucleotide-binding universal stress UspA family protein